MKKILFNGYYGFNNMGDDSFIEVCAWGAKNIWNTTNSTFLSHSIPSILNPAKHLHKKMFNGQNRIETLLLSMQADYFITAGGSTFSQHRKFSLKEIAKWSGKLNIKLQIGAIGVSLGPFKSIGDEKKTIKYLKELDFLTLRDNRSFEFANSINTHYRPIKAFDLAALLPYVYNFKSKTLDVKENIIGVSYCLYEKNINGNPKKDKERLEYISKLLISIIKDTTVKLRFYIINNNSLVGDYKPTFELISKINNANYEIVHYDGNLQKIWYSISECKIIISTRLHASIFACYQNIPFFLIEYHKKCSDFILDIGQNSKYRIYDCETPINSIKHQVENILESNKYEKPIHTTKTIELSLNNFKAINVDD